MKVGDLVRGTPATAPEYRDYIGIVVGLANSRGRIIVKWNDMQMPYPEPRHYLEVISESR